jgi:hypothetical protein
MNCCCRAADGEDEDHDFRKLKKADRMRLVVKNKEEGTELFKGGNIRPAAARYQKALSHAGDLLLCPVPWPASSHLPFHLCCLSEVL